MCPRIIQNPVNILELKFCSEDFEKGPNPLLDQSERKMLLHGPYLFLFFLSFFIYASGLVNFLYGVGYFLCLDRKRTCHIYKICVFDVYKVYHKHKINNSIGSFCFGLSKISLGRLKREV